MRSSKSRSRSKTNRPRTLGNIINRVFDSSGPEGKVRGTPQQIIEKYLFLARDAQLSNDRVAAENFLQHAEHYTRMLGEANRELAAEQESRQQYQPQPGSQNGNQNSNQNGGNGGQNGQRERDGQRYDARPDGRPDNRPEQRSDNRNDQRPEQRSENRNDQRQDRDRNEPRRDDRQAERPEFRSDYRADFNSNRAPDTRAPSEDVIDLSGDEDNGLVETPEAAKQVAPRAQEPRKPQPKPAVKAEVAPPAEADVSNAIASEGTTAAPEATDAAPKPRAASTRRPRSPKKPAESQENPGPSPEGTPREAAE